MLKAMLDFNRALLRMPKPWVAWVGLLFFVNSVPALVFIGTSEGRVVLATLLGSGLLMVALFAAKGFVRLLGAGHAPWLGLVPWLAVRLGEAGLESALAYWVLAVILLDSASLVLDGVGVWRYVRGERGPQV